MRLSRPLTAPLGALTGLALVAGGLALAASPAAAAPGAPTTVSPAYSDEVASNPVLDWDPVVGAVAYRVQVSTSSSFSSLAYTVDTAATRATPPTDLPNSPLYWRVAAVDAARTVGAFSPYVLFTKSATAGPQLIGPASGSTLTYPDQAPVLTWSGLSGVKSYTVTLADNDGFTGATTFTTSNTQLALTEPLLLDKDYAWKVQGVSATTGVTTAESATSTFRLTWSDAPAQSSPASGSDVQQVVLRWTATPGAKHYELEVSPNGDFTNNRTLLDGKTTQKVLGTEYTPVQVLPTASYFWRVRAVDDAVTGHPGPWSPAGSSTSFTVAPPAAPTELHVGDDSYVVEDPSFRWQGVPRASSYELAVSTYADFRTVPTAATQTCTTYHTSYTPYLKADSSPVWTPSRTPCLDGATSAVKLAPGVQYFWRVRGVDDPAGSFGQWSDTKDFIYRDAVPAMTSPYDGESTSAPVLTWDAVPGIGQYKVSITPATGGTATTRTTYATTLTPIGSSTASAPLKPGDYTWTVQTVAADGSLGPTPAPRRFTLTALSGQSSLDQVGPADGAASVRMPSLSWTPVTGASYYLVYYRPQASSSWTSLLSSSTKLYLPAVTKDDAVLTPGTYAWQVRAYSSSGVQLTGAAGVSGERAFTVQPPTLPVPARPAGCAATDVPPACTAGDTPQLSWEGVTDAVSYQVTLAADSAFTNKLRVYSTQAHSLTVREDLPDNQAGKSYYWFVQACYPVCGPADSDKAALAAGLQSFRKASRAVVQKSPADLSTVTDEAHLVWEDYAVTNGDLPTSSGARAYHVQVATDSAFNNLVDDATVDATRWTSWAKNYPDGVYSWRVQALDGSAQGLTWSATRTFTKTSRQPVPAPVTTTTPLPTLTWEPLPYVGSYVVELYRGTDPTFPSASRVTGSPATTKFAAYTPSAPLPAGDYSWRVRKVDASGGTGPWSAGVPTFTVKQGAPGLTAPKDAAKLRTDDLLFTWSAPSGPAVAAYRFESSTTSAFTSLVEGVTTVMASWAPVVRYADTTHYWRVRALDGAGNVLATSATRRFTKDVVAPAVTSVPTSGVPVDGPVTVSFSEPVKGLSTSSLRLRVAGTAVDLPGKVAGNGSATATFTPKDPLVPGQRYTVLLSKAVTDAIGNPLPATTRDTRAVTAVETGSTAVDERWDVDTSAQASGGSYAGSATPGAAASLTFTGTSATLLGRRGPDGGKADVWLDGAKVASVSSYAASPQWQVPLWTGSGLSSGAHALRVVVAAGAPSGSTGTWTWVDAVTVGAAVVQESAVTTRFATVAATGASGGDYDVESHSPAGDTGATPEYRVTLRGTSLTVTGPRSPAGGQARVLVDGTLVGTVDAYAASPVARATLLQVGGLSDAEHVVRVVLTGAAATASTGTAVAVDTLATT